MLRIAKLTNVQVILTAVNVINCRRRLKLKPNTTRNSWSRGGENIFYLHLKKELKLHYYPLVYVSLKN